MDADGITSGIRNKRENHSLLLTILIISIAIPSEKIILRGAEIPIKRIVFNNPRIYALLVNRLVKFEKPINEPFTGLSRNAYIRERQKGKIKKMPKPIRPGRTNKKPWLNKPVFFAIDETPLRLNPLFINVTR